MHGKIKLKLGNENYGYKKYMSQATWMKSTKENYMNENYTKWNYTNEK